MQVIQTILATVVPVFAIVGLGFVYGRFRTLPAKELSDLLVWIMIPCLVLGSVGSKSISLLEFVHIGAAALIVVIGSGLVAFLVFAGKPERRALLLPSAFMNSANMAFPLALLAFGDAGLMRQILFYIAVNLIHVTLGVAIASGRQGLKEAFKLPLVYSAALAIVLAASHSPLPQVVTQPLDLVGKATIPIMLLLLGTRLSSTRLKHIKLATISSIIRIGVGFGLGVACVWLFGLTGTARAAVLLGAVMPAAVLNFVLSEKYNLRPELVASTVVISTIISIGTTPLALYYIKAF